MEVFLFATAGIAFTAALVWLMVKAAKAKRLGVAAFLGVMALSTPLSYPVALLSGGAASASVGVLLIIGMTVFVVWLAHRAYRSDTPQIKP